MERDEGRVCKERKEQQTNKFENKNIKLKIYKTLRDKSRGWTELKVVAEWWGKLKQFDLTG